MPATQPRGSGQPEIWIADHDPGWPLRFAELGGRLRHALGPVAIRIDHVGSTSVPGLAAKPVIDIQISVARLGSARGPGGPVAIATGPPGLGPSPPGPLPVLAGRGRPPIALTLSRRELR